MKVKKVLFFFFLAIQSLTVASLMLVTNIFFPGFYLQVGHAGTLDPMATGLLIVCVGKATKLVER